MKKTPGQLVKCCVCEALSVKGRGHSVEQNLIGLEDAPPSSILTLQSQSINHAPLDLPHVIVANRKPQDCQRGISTCQSLSGASKSNGRTCERVGLTLVLVKTLKEKSIHEKEVTTVVEEDGLTWMKPIIEYLKEGTLPEDKKEESKLCIKARQYELWEGVLYRRSFIKPWLRNPQQPLTPITAPWPFYKWGIDIAGPFSEGPGKVKFLIVAMDYFTKWIKAKAVSTITSNQFSDNPFKDWCEKLNITQRFASVKHPQSNGLVERANRSLGDRIKARLGKGNKIWIEELPHILWAHRTTIKSSHGDTPFSLTYGTEAVIPAEIEMPTYRTTAVDAVHNDEELWLNLVLLEERRERAAIREAKAKLQMTKYYNARVRGVTFRLGDFVYRSNDASHVVAGGKLGPNSGMMGETDPMGTENHPTLLLLLGAAMTSSSNISSLMAQGFLGSRTSGYTGIFSWEGHPLNPPADPLMGTSDLSALGGP
ncbi:reverse transcriptase domain-containing protein [Tanacetum coccineum]